MCLKWDILTKNHLSHFVRSICPSSCVSQSTPCLRTTGWCAKGKIVTGTRHGRGQEVCVRVTAKWIESVCVPGCTTKWDRVLDGEAQTVWQVAGFSKTAQSTVQGPALCMIRTDFSGVCSKKGPDSISGGLPCAAYWCLELWRVFLVH